MAKERKPNHKKMRRSFPNFEAWKAYGIEQGFDKMRIVDVKMADRSFYSIGWLRKWSDQFFVRETRIWSSFDQWYKTGEEKGYLSLSITDLQEKDESWLRTGYRHKFPSGEQWITRLDLPTKRQEAKAPTVLKQRQKNAKNLWKKEGVQAYLDYGKKRGYHKLQRTELERVNRNYYGIGLKYKIRGSDERWLDKLIPPRISNPIELRDFIEQTPAAKSIASLAIANGYAGDIADILVKLWPERFPSAAKLVRELPGAVRRIGHSLQPFDFPYAADLYEKLPPMPSKIKQNLEETLYLIICDQYQSKFNQNPQRTLEEIQQFTDHHRLKDLASRVLDFYKNVYTFTIPGWKKMKYYSEQTRYHSS